MSVDARDTWPNATMPLLRIEHLWDEAEDGDAPQDFFIFQLQVERNPTLYVVGIILPCMLMVMLTLLTFIGRDDYNKLGTAFTTLLMMAVYADQVKNSTPSHVQYLTWVDIFILSNLLINVAATVNSCLMIWFHERGWEHWHDALGNAAAYTQIPWSIFLNILLVIIGATQGQKERSDLQQAGLLIVALVLVLSALISLLICWLVLLRAPPKSAEEDDGRLEVDPSSPAILPT